MKPFGLATTSLHRGLSLVLYGRGSRPCASTLTRGSVLDIAKIESGQFTLNMAEYDIESVETVGSATESLAQNKRLALKTKVAESLPTGLGDEQRLTQVLLNLVGNAIKFTDTGEVCLTAKAVNGRFNVHPCLLQREIVTAGGPDCGSAFEEPC
jgi:signal transduction histidine kinase